MSSSRHLSRAVLCAGALVTLSPAVLAQIAVSPGGQASYGIAIAATPGIAGMVPNLSLSYGDGGINGPVGVGWSVQGVSSITRCPSTRAVDSSTRTVDFTAADKLCLDGQRLIQTDAAGNWSGIAQTGDAGGVSGSPPSTWREFRTEKDTYARIRAYGTAGSDASNGPSYFKVWTKSGQVYEYGTSPGGAPSNALVTASLMVSGVTRTPVAVWAVSRISDVSGNYIDFKYYQRRIAWGSGVTLGGEMASEWNLAEVQYTGNGSTQLPHNKIVFSYVDRPGTASPGYDRAEAYQFSHKNVSVQLLTSIKSYVNSPNPGTLGPATGAVPVRVLKLAYERSPITGRSRVTTLTECAGSDETKCLPATRFSYTGTGSVSYVRNTTLGDAGSGLRYLRMADPTGNWGVLTGDFDGDGRTDVLRWSTSTSQNQLWRSTGDGSFTQWTGFNLTGTSLFTTDGCYSSSASDFNGDGLTDILRVVKPGCASAASLLYLSNGDGTFNTATMPSSISFARNKPSYRAYPADCVDTTNLRVAPKATASTGSREQFDDFGPPVAATGTTGGLGSKGQADRPPDGTPCATFTRSQGNRFYVMDVNGDGLMDIITTILPAYSYAAGAAQPSEADLCSAAGGCSRVFIGNATGGFTELPSTGIPNIRMVSLYNDPPAPNYGNPYWRQNELADINGDGLQDILSYVPDNVPYGGRWRSLGTGDFISTAVQDNAQLCGMPIDFNGDGRADCLRPDAAVAQQSLTLSYGASSSGSVVQFNVNVAGDNLYGADGYGRQNIGVLVDDFDGDGRQDILRWGPNVSDNGIYFSRGDGSFTTRTAAGLTSITRPLQSADGSTTFVAGDFLGTGSIQFLHLKDNPPASGGTVDSTNQLYQRLNYTGPADGLASVLSSTGLLSTVGPRVSLVNSNGRYLNERGTGQAATSPLVDIQPPMYVITSLQQETDAGNLTTEYLYKGLKAERGGRGMLGFREVRQQNPVPGGEFLTTASEFLLQHPYDGVTARTQTYLGGFSAVGSTTPLSKTENAYCDTTSATPPVSASVAAPCASMALVRRPYLRQSVEEGRDLSGTQLPKVTTTNTYNDFGDPLTIVTLSEGNFAGAMRQYLKTTTNTFCVPDSGGCPNSIANNNWILGRLTRAEVSNSVPNLLSALSASAGNSSTATATTGSPPLGSNTLVNPAVLAVILQLLLED